MEKPRSNRAKRFYRFHGKQNHGTAAQRKGHEGDDKLYQSLSLSEKRKKMARSILREIEDGLAESGGYEDPAELTIQATHQKADKESDEYIEEFGAGKRKEQSEDLNEDAVLNRLYRQSREVLDHLNHLPLKTPDEKVMSQRELDSLRDYLEGELEDLRDQIEAIEGNSLPTAAQMGQLTLREINASKLRTATLDNEYNENDDFGDYVGDSHIRISSRPR